MLKIYLLALGILSLITFFFFLALFTLLLIAEVGIMCKAIKNWNMEDSLKH